MASFEDRFGRKTSRDVRDHFDHERLKFGDRHAESSTRRALNEATFGRGPLAGKTGDPFKDNPFFNPWAPGGSFNRRGR